MNDDTPKKIIDVSKMTDDEFRELFHRNFPFWTVNPDCPQPVLGIVEDSAGEPWAVITLGAFRPAHAAIGRAARVKAKDATIEIAVRAELSDGKDETKWLFLTGDAPLLRQKQWDEKGNPPFPAGWPEGPKYAIRLPFRPRDLSCVKLVSA